MAGPKTEGNGQIQKREAKPADVLAKWVQTMGPQIARAVPKHLDPERIARIATTAIQTTDHLADCTVPSFLGCLLQSAQLGLEPNSPLAHCFLVPRWDKKANGGAGAYVCTFQLGFQGMIELAYRTNKVRAIWAEVVFQGDKFTYERGLDPKLVHVPTETESNPSLITHSYAVAALGEGSFDRHFVVCPRRVLDAAYAKRANKTDWSPWETAYEEMAKKTAIRRLYKLLPKSAELSRAMTIDEKQPSHTSVDPQVIDVLAESGHELPASTDDDRTIDTTEAKGD